MNITEFLLARIAEDEQLAQAAIDNAAPEEWESELGDMNLWPEDIAFWANNTPPRILAECAAKRAIVAAHPLTTDVVEVSTRIKPGFACETCFSFGDVVEDSGYCDTLRAIAAVYAGHPDYQEYWKP